MQKFQNRQQAGKLLAAELEAYTDRADVIVLGLPRGGVPVAFEIARALHLLLDVFVVRKLGVPGQEELAMGAIATGGVQVLNEKMINDFNVSMAALHSVREQEQQELIRREKVYRGGRNSLDLTDKIVILVDDGIATGATLRAAIKALRILNQSFIVIAVPVGDKVVCQQIELLADQLICLLNPPDFYAVGAHYEDFAQTTDAEVHLLLAENLKQTKEVK